MKNDSLIGTQLGPYLIQAKIAEGGMAEVYRAYHARLRRDVAIKVILPQVAGEAGFRERFEREAQVVANLEHRNIVGVYDFGEVDNLTYLVMQYVGGGTLRDQMRGGQSLDARRAAQYALQMARALHYAHIRGIVHRDVKPQNMLVSTNDRNEILLSDFGIAKLFGHRREETLPKLPQDSTNLGPGGDSALTQAGQMVGTADYMAPEQINHEPVDARTDVYALGVVLFQMLTGQTPFQSSSLLGLLYQHVHVPAPFVRQINPQVPEALAQIAAKALAKAPEARFQSAEEMAKALETFLAPSTNPLAASWEGNYATFGRAPSDLLTQAPPPPPSAYQSGPYTPSYPAQQTYSTAPPPPSAVRVSGSGGGFVAPTPAPPASQSRRALRYIGLGLVSILAILAFLFQRGIISLPNFGSGGGSHTATSFTDDFKVNPRSWPTDSLGLGSDGRYHLTATLNSSGYMLTIDNTVPNASYFFPHPDLNAVGTLPNNFTLQAQITQTQGGTDVFYGITFHYSEQAGGSKPYCYAFVIDSKGDAQFWRYDSDARSHPQTIRQGPSAAIHTWLGQLNTLQVTATGNMFSFQINGTPVQFGSDTTFTDNTGSMPFTGGDLGLVLTGPGANFTVTQVQLTVPAGQ